MGTMNRFNPTQIRRERLGTTETRGGATWPNAWYMLQALDEATARRHAHDEIGDDPRKD
jgi:hypothetical protein